MDCQSKDGLIIFLLILSGELVVESKHGLIIVNFFLLSGILAAIVTGGLVLLCRKRVCYLVIH